MPHFNKDFIDFFKELEENNNREWFTENKERYEKSVKIPFEHFVQDMIYRIHEVDENLMLTPKEAIFRIYRDIRFSKDKTPYKTHVSAVISNGGRKNFDDPGVYIEIGADYLRFYGGLYQLDKNQIEKVRRFIASNLQEFEKLLTNKNFKKYFLTVRGESNKRIPKEFLNAYEQQPLIANKQFYYFTELSGDKITTKNLPQMLMKFYLAAEPMSSFLSRALS
jgi:uncharacterized protein (TIGR02453 family)